MAMWAIGLAAWASILVVVLLGSIGNLEDAVGIGEHAIGLRRTFLPLIQAGADLKQEWLDALSTLGMRPVGQPAAPHGAELPRASPREGSGLRDPPIAGEPDAIMYLDGAWQAFGLARTWDASPVCFNFSRELNWMYPGPTNYVVDWPTNAAGTCGQCSVERDIDYGESPGTGTLAKPVYYTVTPQQCCEYCGASSTCAAAVWGRGGSGGAHGTNWGECRLKTADDLRRRVSRANVTAMVPERRSEWKQISISATVPGDLVTDLQAAGVIPDPLFGTNFKNTSMWGGPTWNYTTVFSLPPKLQGVRKLLVFEGIKMGARIILNGEHLGNATDQHRRYVFNVDGILSGAESNSLSVVFDFSVDMSDGRYMHSSGGLDWGPYSNARTSGGGLPFFSRGIWKSVYIIGHASSSAAITSFVPLVKYVGESWPTSALSDGAAPFEVDARIFLDASQPVEGIISVIGDWGGSAEQQVQLEAGENRINLTVPAAAPRLWWARGMGEQVMYNISVVFSAATGGAAIHAQRRIGFRHLVLVTGNDTNSTWVDEARNAEGNDHFTLMLRLNGAPVAGRGANMIPMEMLEGRYVPGMQRHLVMSAAEAGMTLLRIYGGGIYPFEELLDACDEFGVLSTIDMQYISSGVLMPQAKPTADQRHEISGNVRRMSHHPSIAWWSGCNECGGGEVYTSFIMTTVAQEDDSRPIRSSNPFNGYCTGVHRLSGLPNGRTLSSAYWPTCKPPGLAADQREVGGHTGEELHGPYHKGGNWAMINGGGGKFGTACGIQVPYDLSQVGAGASGYMRAETGANTMSSFESMSATLPQEEWGLHGQSMHERNYPCDNIVQSYFSAGANMSLSSIGEASFKKQLYLCMLGQAFERKAWVEAWRSSNVWGLMLWTLNDVWPTGGWGSLEYGTPVQGQVLGGRWKILHHFLRTAAFVDVPVACGVAVRGQNAGVVNMAGSVANADALCYVRNDLPHAFNGTIITQLINLATGEAFELTQIDVSLAAGAGTMALFCPDGEELLTSIPQQACSSYATLLRSANCANASSCYLQVTLVGSDTPVGTLLAQNVHLLVAPFQLQLSRTEVTAEVLDAPENVDAPEEDRSALIHVRCETGVAAYVWLSTLAQGRFEPNGFMLSATASPMQVKFIAFGGPVDKLALIRSLRVEHLGEHLQSSL